MNRNLTMDYIEFPAKDIETTKTFFSELFGWTFEDYGPDYSSFNDGRTDGGFYRSDNVATVETGSVLVVFYAEELEPFLNKVKEVGGHISQDIYDFPGGRRFHFLDPNGNEYAVWSE